MSAVDRFGRISQVELIGVEGLATLRASRAAVVGVGNVGGQLIAQLASLGLDRLVLVDRDRVGVENLATQGFAEDHVGLPKVVARARVLARLSPACAVTAIHADVERLGLGALGDAHVIFACPDSIRARVAVNEIAVRLGLPWVDAAVDGSGQSFVSRVAAYAPSETSPCYRCQWEAAYLWLLLRREQPAGCPTWRWGGGESPAPPTLAIAAVGGAIAAAAAVTGLKILLGRGAEVIGHEMLLDLDTRRLSTHAIVRNPRCGLDHRRLALTPLGRPPAAMTVGETFALAEDKLGAGIALALHREAAVVTRVDCPACARTRSPYRLVQAMTEDAGRCECGESMQPLATGLLDRFTRAEAEAFLDRTWAALGLPARDVVTAEGGGAACHLLFE